MRHDARPCRRRRRGRSRRSPRTVGSNGGDSQSLVVAGRLHVVVRVEQDGGPAVAGRRAWRARRAGPAPTVVRDRRAARSRRVSNTPVPRTSSATASALAARAPGRSRATRRRGCARGRRGRRRRPGIPRRRPTDGLGVADGAAVDSVRRGWVMRVILRRPPIRGLPWQRTPPAPRARSRRRRTTHPRRPPRPARARRRRRRAEQEAARKRPLVPNDRKEAAKQARAKQAEAREQARVGMAAGDDRYLPARDQGPQKQVRARLRRRPLQHRRGRSSR